LGVAGVVSEGVGVADDVGVGDAGPGVEVADGDTDGTGVVDGAAELALGLELAEGVPDASTEGVFDVPPLASFTMRTTATTTMTATTAATTRRRDAPAGPAVGDVDGSAVMGAPRVTTGSYRRHRE